VGEGGGVRKNRDENNGRVKDRGQETILRREGWKRGEED